MKRAIIIGNGFDLELGAKTSFHEFLHHYSFQSIKAENSLKQFYDQLSSQSENWCDLEGSLKDWVAWLNERPSHKAEAQNRTFAKSKRETHFEELRQAIKAFIQECQLPRLNNKETPLNRLVTAWCKDATVSVFNFNYTDTAESFIHVNATMNGYKFNGQVKHLHGRLDEDNIVFGTIEEDTVENYRFIAKPVAPHYKGTNIRNELLGCSSIEIVGHSLGRSDWTYFKRILQDILDKGEDGALINVFGKNRADAGRLRSNIAEMFPGLLGQLSMIDKEPKFFGMDELAREHTRELSKLIETTYGHNDV